MRLRRLARSDTAPGGRDGRLPGGHLGFKGAGSPKDCLPYVVRGLVWWAIALAALWAAAVLSRYASHAIGSSWVSHGLLVAPLYGFAASYVGARAGGYAPVVFAAAALSLVLGGMHPLMMGSHVSAAVATLVACLILRLITRLRGRTVAWVPAAVLGMTPLMAGDILMVLSGYIAFGQLVVRMPFWVLAAVLSSAGAVAGDACACLTPSR